MTKPSVMPSHMSEFCQYVYYCASCLEGQMKETIRKKTKFTKDSFHLSFTDSCQMNRSEDKEFLFLSLIYM